LTIKEKVVHPSKAGTSGENPPKPCRNGKLLPDEIKDLTVRNEFLRLDIKRMCLQTTIDDLLYVENLFSESDEEAASEICALGTALRENLETAVQRIEEALNGD
jgi:hypothetical protein